MELYIPELLGKKLKLLTLNREIAIKRDISAIYNCLYDHSSTYINL